MADQTALPPPHRHWWNSRKLVGLGVLLGLIVAGFWLHDVFWLPEDQRRMQGKWKIVKITEGDRERPNPFPAGKDIVVFAGRRLFWPGAEADPMPLEINQGKFTSYPDHTNRQRVFGFKVPAPIWLIRPTQSVFGSYEFQDDQLVLWIKGEGNLTRQQKAEREEQGHRIYLERQ